MGGGADRAVFAGLSRSDVSLVRTGDSLLVDVRATTDSVFIRSFFRDTVDLDLVFRDGALSAGDIA